MARLHHHLPVARCLDGLLEPGAHLCVQLRHTDQHRESFIASSHIDRRDQCCYCATQQESALQSSPLAGERAERKRGQRQGCPREYAAPGFACRARPG